MRLQETFHQKRAHEVVVKLHCAKNTHIPQLYMHPKVQTHTAWIHSLKCSITYSKPVHAHSQSHTHHIHIHAYIHTWPWHTLTMTEPTVTLRLINNHREWAHLNKVRIYGKRVPYSPLDAWLQRPLHLSHCICTATAHTETVSNMLDIKIAMSTTWAEAHDPELVMFAQVTVRT